MNQSEREPTTRTRKQSNKRDLFHPDYDRRLWSLTRSADPKCRHLGARGLLQTSQLPPVGSFAPPWERCWLAPADGIL